MNTPNDATREALGEAHGAASLIADRYRSYLPGLLMSVLVEKFRDDMAEATGSELPPLPLRPPARLKKADGLTSSELSELSGAVTTLATRFTARMDDPALPGMLRDFRDALAAETADRARIAQEMTAKAKAP